MKRDMDLVRLILLKIEEDYVSTALYNLKIDGYDKETIAYHCKMLHEAGFVSDYGSHYADNALQSFGVGSLTWERNEFLDKIRDDSFWGKTKKEIKNRGLPMIVDTIKAVSTAVISAATEGAVSAYLKNGGQP